ncbi:hypothetical protein BJ166DRAFT_603549 [Pestalotiopsis sp. NC0098]|nr:hypothetical protein BJ166DRAFT_603549 [Pestalotiopsis sp. NC0098]
MQIGCYVLFGLCTFTVILRYPPRPFHQSSANSTFRLYVRTIRSHRVGLDDCFILAAWISEIAVIISVKMQFQSGIGWHAADLATLPDGARILSSIVLWPWVAQFTYFFQLGCIKSSIVSLYLRLAVTPGQVKVLWVALAVIFGQGLSSAIAVAVFICRPVSLLWENAEEFGGPKCFNILAFNYYNAAFFILSDLFLAAAPIMVLKDMQMNKKRKMLLGFMFSLGILAIGGTVSRQVTNAIAINNTDLSWYWAPAELCSVLESSLGIVFVCVPAIIPLFSNVMGSAAKKSGQEDIDLANSRNPDTFGKMGRNPKRKVELGDETLLCETQLSNLGGHESDVASQRSGYDLESCGKVPEYSESTRG